MRSRAVSARSRAVPCRARSAPSALPCNPQRQPATPTRNGSTSSNQKRGQPARPLENSPAHRHAVKVFLPSTRRPSSEHLTNHTHKSIPAPPAITTTKAQSEMKSDSNFIFIAHRLSPVIKILIFKIKPRKKEMNSYRCWRRGTAAVEGGEENATIFPKKQPKEKTNRKEKSQLKTMNTKKGKKVPRIR